MNSDVSSSDSIALHLSAFCPPLLKHLVPEARASSQNSLSLTHPSPLSSPTHRAMSLETYDSSFSLLTQWPTLTLGLSANEPLCPLCCSQDSAKSSFISALEPTMSSLCPYPCIYTHMYCVQAHTCTHRVPSVPDLHAFASPTPIHSLGFT